MLKHLFGSLSVLALLAVAQPALASLDIDGTPWTKEFDGAGSPLAQGWTAYTYTSSTYNDDFKYLSGPPYNVNVVGWLSTAGNPGGLIASESAGNGLTKAGGWTVEWGMLSIAGTQTRSNVIYVDDDSDGLRIDFGPNTVTLRREDSGSSDSASLDLTNCAEHVYRIVRQAGSSTVELYLDNDFTSPAAQITMNNSVGNPNRVLWGDSVYEASYDFFRFHSGATTVIPEPASLALMALGALAMLGRKR